MCETSVARFLYYSTCPYPKPLWRHCPHFAYEETVQVASEKVTFFTQHFSVPVTQRSIGMCLHCPQEVVVRATTGVGILNF